MMTWQLEIGTACRKAVKLVLCTGALAAGQGMAGGLIAYEVGTADVGLASAGYGARAQDASTVLSNPAGMTRLEGTQFLAGGQLLWGNTKFSADTGTSPGLGGDNGGYAVGSNGWFPGGGGFLSYSVSPDLKLGFAVTGNFGAPLSYDNDWVGRYYVQETTLLGISLLPSIAYKVNDKLSLGAGVNAMYGIYTNYVAINNPAPGLGDGRLKLDDRSWGWGLNLGLLYEIDPGTRLGLTWNSQIDLDFKGPAKFSNLGPGLATILRNRGTLDADIKVGINVPQQAMASVFTQVNDRWAVLGSVGWQQWSKFGEVQLGISDTNDPVSLTQNLNFKDTWHVALGAQHRLSELWLLNFGVAYDSGMQSGDVSPLLPVNSAWRFGVGGEQQLSKTTYWGIAAEYLYGGKLDTQLQTTAPVALGGRGNVVGSYNNTDVIYVAAYYNWKFF
ncbi:outer membrane protein transport protein [Candidatus Accumulibacter sp. ACC012]|jgi:long-chain fatty acid transport protein|uniref:OmpP1/FadL family transporter n=1 Tax=Candidatus Accumulibacter sp. ACC012 TaxID=2823332 RepID=UPI0025BF018C|nr:outer membrane protein transport protein [Candidatus Accumulibacter sp. ACC012]